MQVNQSPIDFVLGKEINVSYDISVIQKCYISTGKDATEEISKCFTSFKLLMMAITWK